MHQKMTREPAFRANSSPSTCSPIKAFFAIPNPRVVRLLVISSAATFSLGIAMMVEWSLHAKHHHGYEWLVYFAALVVALPILAWTVLILSAAFLCGGASSLERLRVTGSPGSILSRPQRKEADEEAKHKEICSSDHEQGLVQDEVSDVQNEGFGDHVRAYGSRIPYNFSRTTAADGKIAFERAFSLPSMGNAREYNDIERSLSSCL
ncbi:hypothetical protein ACJRO7_003001 [Eucalyptus globulus]|uniref:Uncharacterized protein n=1 Tax=Eucalyptus globulus TaxID=34317 RepID=A0ABD3IU83_EUCGL